MTQKLVFGPWDFFGSKIGPVTYGVAESEGPSFWKTVAVATVFFTIGYTLGRQSRSPMKSDPLVPDTSSSSTFAGQVETAPPSAALLLDDVHSFGSSSEGGTPRAARTADATPVSASSAVVSSARTVDVECDFVSSQASTPPMVSPRS